MLAYVLFALSAILSGAITHFLSKWAQQRKKFLPPVRERDVHTKPVPRVGGIAIVASFYITTLLITAIFPDLLSFTNTKVLGIDRSLFGLFMGLFILTAVNILDDYKSLRWQWRLLAQIASAVIIIAFGIRVDWLTNPFGGVIQMGQWGSVFVIIWIVSLTNATNWLDGVNGLAGGVGAIALAILYFLSISPEVQQDGNALLAAISCGAVIGFLPFNIVRAKAFLGDTGSMFIGFLVGAIAIISGGKVATAFLVLAIPFLDSIVVIITRLLNKQSPFRPDNRHLHHKLLQLGLKPYQIVLVIYTVSLFFGLLALYTQPIGKVAATILALLMTLALVLIYTVKTKKMTKDGEK
ncbi:undecaprenyl/decaprenyl-phosphate alpha-N-acetylglucosaminyl 1-phosphate transferase [Candidatus Berkelbacteria bacterium]|nr:undecaprenyl/decaprenyl-phosphate alpha-N-acetylglucosaminyl 1-phosphate transferase [Candidatus Berkelbacteria bacterium]